MQPSRGVASVWCAMLACVLAVAFACGVWYGRATLPGPAAPTRAMPARYAIARNVMPLREGDVRFVVHSLATTPIFFGG